MDGDLEKLLVWFFANNRLFQQSDIGADYRLIFSFDSHIYSLIVHSICQVSYAIFVCKVTIILQSQEIQDIVLNN